MDVLNSAKSPLIDYQMAKNVYGGNFFTDLKSFGKNVFTGLKSGIREAIPIAKELVGVARDVAPLLPLFGLGEDEENMGEGVVAGGARARKSKLRSRLRRV
jgi:hypothetical protein